MSCLIRELNQSRNAIAMSDECMIQDALREGFAKESPLPEERTEEVMSTDFNRESRKDMLACPTGQQKDSSLCTLQLPPKTNTNAVPNHTQKLPIDYRGAYTTSPPKQCPIRNTYLNILWPRDIAVIRYGEWQQMQVHCKEQQEEFHKAGSIVLEHMLDLEQIYEDQDPDFFYSRGVKIGVARRYVTDIVKWAAEHEMLIYI